MKQCVQLLFQTISFVVKFSTIYSSKCSTILTYACALTKSPLGNGQFSSSSFFPPKNSTNINLGVSTLPCGNGIFLKRIERDRNPLHRLQVDELQLLANSGHNSTGAAECSSHLDGHGFPLDLDDYFPAETDFITITHARRRMTISTDKLRSWKF